MVKTRITIQDFKASSPVQNILARAIWSGRSSSLCPGHAPLRTWTSRENLFPFNNYSDWNFLSLASVARLIGLEQISGKAATLAKVLVTEAEFADVKCQDERIHGDIKKWVLTGVCFKRGRINKNEGISSVIARVAADARVVHS